MGKIRHPVALAPTPAVAPAGPSPQDITMMEAAKLGRLLQQFQDSLRRKKPRFFWTCWTKNFKQMSSIVSDTIRIEGDRK